MYGAKESCRRCQPPRTSLSQPVAIPLALHLSLPRVDPSRRPLIGAASPPARFPLSNWLADVTFSIKLVATARSVGVVSSSSLSELLPGEFDAKTFFELEGFGSESRCARVAVLMGSV